MNCKSIDILLIEDNPGDVTLIREMLNESRNLSFKMTHALRLDEALSLMARTTFDVALLDLNLPDSRGVDSFLKLHNLMPTLPVVVLTGLADEDLGAKAVRSGAQDYLLKGEVDGNLLIRAICYAIERSLVEKALKESEERYRLLVEHSPFLIAVHQDMKFQYVNPAGTRLLGAFGPEEIVGKSILEIVPEDYRKIVRTRVEKNIESHESPPLREQKLLRLDGDLVDVEVTGVPITYRGKPASQVIMSDITARKKMEEELLKAKKLEAAGILAGGIAHDFNNLLGIILGYIKLAQMDIEPEGPARKNLENAEDAALEASRLTRKFITFSGGGAPVREIVSIDEVIAEAIDLVPDDSSVKCHYSTEAGLRPVAVDKGQMLQAISNLIVNAREAMPQGGTVSITAKNTKVGAGGRKSALFVREGSYVEVTVKDQGAGISEENQDKIFDPYFSTKERGAQKGMGLGLTVTYSVVKNHAGYIAMESRENVGTVFSVLIPAVHNSDPT